MVKFAGIRAAASDGAIHPPGSSISIHSDYLCIYFSRDQYLRILSQTDTPHYEPNLFVICNFDIEGDFGVMIWLLLYELGN